MARQTAFDPTEPSKNTPEQQLAQAKLFQGTPRGREAFAEFARSIERFIVNQAGSLIPLGSDVDDVKQQTLLNIWLGLASYQIGRPVKPWVARIVRNTAVSLHRPVASLRIVHNSDLVDGLAEASAANGDPEDDPTLRVESLLETLPRQAREMIELKHLQGRTLKEIARIFQITPQAVGCRLHSYRNKLRNTFGAEADNCRPMSPSSTEETPPMSTPEVRSQKDNAGQNEKATDHRDCSAKKPCDDQPIILPFRRPSDSPHRPAA